MNPNQIQVHPARIVDAITLAAEAGNAEHKVARLERALKIAREGLEETSQNASNGLERSVASRILAAIERELES